jgi:hypothetical protein
VRSNGTARCLVHQVKGVPEPGHVPQTEVARAPVRLSQGLLLHGGVDRLGPKHLHAVQLASARERRVHPSEAAGGAQARGGPVGRGPPLAGVAGSDQVVGADHLGTPMVVFRTEPDHEVGTEGLADLLAEERGERAPVDPSHDLAHEIAERPPVVLAARARLPRRCSSRECGGERVPVPALVGRDGHRRDHEA